MYTHINNAKLKKLNAKKNSNKQILKKIKLIYMNKYVYIINIYLFWNKYLKQNSHIIYI